ncbi:MAG TPA: DNA-binding response regulator [Chloroflexi bacterium]|nr:DNA-binding response regulator [Chloroflexota bacterium]HHW85221.1 response regulator transcription factor [Chloroflexota bacterium]
MIRVLLCDDQAIVTEGLRVILRQAGDIDVVGVAEHGLAAVEQAAQQHPDVVLMDLRMPVMNGIQATARICQEHPATRVLVLTTYDDDEWVFDAIRAGAAGYLLKDAPREQLIAAIRDTAAGGTHVDPKVAGKLFRFVAQSTHAPAGGLDVDLNVREREILELIAAGLSNAEIAERLYLSKGTVQNYVSAILAKLDVTDRTQAAILALRYGLVGRSDG